MEIIILLLALVALSLAAPRWGVDSTDDIDSNEWARRRDWTGFSR